MSLKLLLLAALPFVAAAQMEVTVVGTTATQAVLRLRGWTGVCTMDVRENNATGTQHPDWTALADSAHPLTTVNARNEKFLIAGRRTGNFALAAQQAYYYSITGCGTASGVFTTRSAVLGAINHKQPAGDPNAWNGLDYPAVDLTATGRNKWYVHPITGIKHKLVTGPEDFSWMDHLNQTFVHPSGGSGWTLPLNIVNGSTSTAQTSNTSPVFLYSNIIGQALKMPWVSDAKTVENLGVVLWAHCVSGTGADCDIELMLFDDPNVLPKAGTNIVTVRAGGSFVQQTGNHPTTGDFASTLSAAVANGTTTYPGGTTGTNGFPRPGFQGWGNFTLTMDMYVRNSTNNATVSAGNTLTIASPSLNANFQRGVKPGQHIFITGSGANCTASGGTDVCTVATVTDSGNLTIAETGLTAGVTAIRPLPWGIAIRKKTNTGTVRIGAMYRAAGHFPYSTGTIQSRCSQAKKTRTDGVVGRLCLIPYGGSLHHLYFISEDGEVVVPIDGLQQLGGPLVGIDFHPTDPATIFANHGTGVYKMTYTGDFGVLPTVWQKDPGAPGGGARYAHKSSQDYPDGTWSDPYFTITLPLPSATIASAILAQYPAQVSPPYAAWGASNFLGVSGDLIGLYRTPEGQDQGPCQVALFNVNDASLVDFINSGDTPGSPMHFGECHSAQFNPSLPNSFLFSYNITGNKGNLTPGLLLHGPHLLQIEAVKRAGVMNTNTCLEWPMGSVSNCTGLGGALPHYDKTCPTVGGGAGQIPQAWADAGAQGSNCVTMRITGSTVAKAICNENGNAAGTTDDFAIFGACEWNAGSTYSGGPTLEAGMKFVDRVNQPGKAGGDYENFRVLTITPTGDSTTLTIVAQRNASREHCCSANSTVNPVEAAPSVCRQGDDYLWHSDNWLGWMVPGSYGSCNAPLVYTTYPDPTTKVGRYYTEIPRELAQGHPALGRTSATAYRFLGGSGGTSLSRNLTGFSDLNIQPPPATLNLNVRYQGVPSPVGTFYQQYLSQTQNDVTDTTNKYYSGDTNHMNGSGGQEQNALAGGMADIRPTFVKVAGFTDLWRLNVASTGTGLSALNTLKIKPVVAWCGPAALSDISSPVLGPQIDTAPQYSYCIAYKDGQCRTGSTAGMAWARCPFVYKNPTASIADDCHTGLEFTSEPCLLAASGSAGYGRRQKSDVPDETGSNQMLLSDFYKPAGSQFAFWDVSASANGYLALASSGGHFGLVRQVSWLAKVPKFPLAQTRWNGLKPIAVKIGTRPGVTHARIKFGNNPAFECNSHYKEACYTDAAQTFYAFAGETPLTPNVCPSGCTLTMYVQADEMLWHQIETSTDGTTFTADPVQVTVP